MATVMQRHTSPSTGPVTVEDPGEVARSPGPPPPAVRDRSVLFHGALIASALVAWLLSLDGIDVEQIAGYGLVPLLPPLYWFALALVAIGFCTHVTSRAPRGVVLFAYVAALVLVLFATTPLLYGVPRYPWTYKHIGVMEFLDANGHFDRRVDIYNNWPGFLALGALFSRLTGVSPAAFAAWAQPFFEVLFAAGVGFVVRALTTNQRVVWFSVFVFLAANWVGQDYLAPQPFAFFLSLVVLGGLLRWFRSPVDQASLRLRRMVRRAGRPGRWVAGLRGSQGHAAELDATGRRWAGAVVIVAYTAMVVSHQLSPVLVLGLVVALSVLGEIRATRLVLAMGAILGVWLAQALPWLVDNLTLLDFGASTANASTAIDLSQASRDSQVISTATQLYSLVVWGLALIGLLRRLRRGLLDQAALVIGFLPFAILVFQSYGGEGIYRVFLFTLPVMAFLIATAVLGVETERPRRALLPGVVVLALLLGGFATAFFGRESVNRVRPGEVQLATDFERNAPVGSLLILSVQPFPDHATGRYPAYKLADDEWDPAVLDVPELVEEVPDPSAPSAIADFFLRLHPGRDLFIAFTEGQRAYVETYGVLPAGDYERLEALLAASPRYEVAFDNASGTIYRIVPRDEVEVGG